MAAFPQQHQQQTLEIVDMIRIALEESNNTYIKTFKSIHQIESEIEQTTGQSIETIQLALHDRIPSTTPGAEPPRDARDSGSARSHSTHLETSSSDRP